MEENTPKSLADLMVQGAKLHPKCKKDFIEYDGGRDAQHIARSCALGAVWIAAKGPTRKGLAYHQSIRDLVNADCAIDLELKVDPPLEDWGWMTLYAAIVILNDDYSWSRTRIASWIRKHEAEWRKATVSLHAEWHRKA